MTLREEVSRLYKQGVDPVRTIQSMLYNVDGSLTTDANKLVEIWLGANDLLDQDDIVNPLRSKLVAIRDVLAKTIEGAGEGPKAFVANFRESTRRMNEMKYLQAYKPKLVDASGVMQRTAFQQMLAEIEDARANYPGSLAQDISAETLAALYRIRDNWDDPPKLK